MASELNNDMYSWAKELFPINRSITGKGLKDTLNYIKNKIPQLSIKSVKSGEKVFDWEVPYEWNVTEAYIINEDNEKIIDFKDNNLHLMSYSIPIEKWITKEDLEKNLYSIPSIPDAIPYVTSYYKRSWGFCIKHADRINLKSDFYKVVIKSTLTKGELNYGELIIPGEEKKEIFISTYICHPSMANNELSGPVVTIALINYLLEKKRKYTYRVVFAPETIGAITYLSKNYKLLKKNVIAGFNMTCMGDERSYSYMPSRLGNTLADKVAKYVLDKYAPSYDAYDFSERGSDERQYCSPLIDIPLVSIMRSKYGTYPEYHTSKDNMDFITKKGLEESLTLHKKCIDIIENNNNYIANQHCEPQLSKRGLYSTLGNVHGNVINKDRILLDILAYADGSLDSIDLANKINVDIFYLFELIDILVSHNLLRTYE